MIDSPAENFSLKIGKSEISLVYKIAFVRTGNHEDAEDISQQVFLNIIKLNRKFNDAEHLKAYLIKASINQIKNFKASAWNKKRGESAEEISVFDKTAEEKIVFAEAINKLSEKDRILILLHYYENLPLLVVAEALNIKENAAKTRLFRAREKLRNILKGDEIDV